MELRPFETKYRGPLLIISNRWPRPLPRLHYGAALGIVTVTDCRRMRRTDEGRAWKKFDPESFAWVLADAKRVKPFAVKGRIGLFSLDVEPELLPGEAAMQGRLGV